MARAQSAGANLGWNCYEGSIAGPGGCTLASHVAPAFDYPQPSGGVAVTGGYVVRDPALPSFQGRYLFGDFFDGAFGNEIQVTTLGPGTATPPQNAGETVASLVAFGEDAGGGLYAVSLNGPLYKLSESGGLLDKAEIGSFEQPMAVAPVPGAPGRLFVVERPGVLKLRDAGGAVHVFLDISASVSTDGERGLLAAAAAPDYPQSGRVFLFYTDTGGDLRIDVVRRSSDPNRADPASRRNVIAIEHSSASNHNGGALHFGPDGHLYVSTGDGGSQGDPENDAQSLGSLLGKVLRLDVRATGGGAGPGGPATDRAPALRARVPRRQRVLRLRGVVGYARCDERCRIAMGGVLRIGKRAYRLRRATRTAGAGERVRLKARLTKRSRRALRRALANGRRPKLRVGLRGRDTAGAPSRLVRATVRVRR